MLRLLTWSGGHAVEVAREELATLLSHRATVWVDIVGPDDEEAALMRDVFHFHPLAIEDTRNQHQRPKVEEYPDHLFLILNPGALVEGDVAFRELDVFLAPHLVVTVHPEPEAMVGEASRRLSRQFPKDITPAHVLYALLDTAVDSYFPMLDELGDEIEQLEDMVLEQPNREALNRLFNLKRQLVMMRKVVTPQRDAMTLLNRRDLPYLDTHKLTYHLRDVQDHLLRIGDMLDTFRDLLSSGIDLYMSATSNRLNRVVNRLTVVTIVIGVLAVITGFYGMNFDHSWPPFHASWGVPFVLAVMVAAVVTIVATLRRVWRL